jgi:putative SOS response-associated peptidase YedK
MDVMGQLEHYEVSREANSVRNNGSQLIEPLG